MRVLYITSLSLKHASGAQDHVMQIYKGLEKEGLEMLLLSPCDFEMGIGGAIKRKIALAKLTQDTIRRFSPDIVYCRYEGADFLSIREIVRHGIPFVLELNTKTVPEFWTTRRYIPFVVSLITEPWVFSRASGIAAVTHEIFEYAVRLGRKEKPFLLAKNGIDTSAFTWKGYDPSLRAQYDTPLNAPLLAMIGSIAPWHGVDILLQALSKEALKNYYLWLIGNIAFSELKEKCLAPNVLERTRIIPWQNPTNLSKLLSSADIGIGALALYRNNLKEAQSLKTRAYLAAGLPVLLGHTDPVISDKHAFISDGLFSSVEELAKKIKDFYERVSKNRHDLGRQAREYAERNLSWDIAAKETADFLKDIYGRNK